MQPLTPMKHASANFRKFSPAVLLFCFLAAGCGTSCYSGFWNGNGSGVAVSNTSCPMTPATGKVTAQMATVSTHSSNSTTLPSPPASPRDIRHIYITLRGIDASVSASPDVASSSWQTLAPNLAAHPVQVDLLATVGDSQSSFSSNSANVSRNNLTTLPAKIAADEYKQLRLQLMAPASSSNAAGPENNACGNAGWNCVVFADSSVRALEFGGDALEIQITASTGSNNLFRVLPDENIHLFIEFDSASSTFVSSSASPNSAVRFVPVFKVVVQNSH